MIRVSMKLDPFGLGQRVRQLADIEIINTGTGSPTRGNYRVRVYTKNGRLMREGQVKNWPRKQKHPVDLLAECLKAIRK